MSEYQETHDQTTHHHYHGCCMGLSGLGPRVSSLLWGTGLLAVGATWLLANALDLDNWGEWLTPIVFVLVGLVVLVAVRLDAQDQG